MSFRGPELLSWIELFCFFLSRGRHPRNLGDRRDTCCQKLPGCIDCRWVCLQNQQDYTRDPSPEAAHAPGGQVSRMPHVDQLGHWLDHCHGHVWSDWWVFLTGHIVCVCDFSRCTHITTYICFRVWGKVTVWKNENGNFHRQSILEIVFSWRKDLTFELLFWHKLLNTGRPRGNRICFLFGILTQVTDCYKENVRRDFCTRYCLKKTVYDIFF